MCIPVTSLDAAYKEINPVFESIASSDTLRGVVAEKGTLLIE